MNDDFFSITQRRKGAKFRCLFLEKILIHTPIQQRRFILCVSPDHIFYHNAPIFWCVTLKANAPYN
jgi:hypothetical protein